MQRARRTCRKRRTSSSLVTSVAGPLWFFVRGPLWSFVTSEPQPHCPLYFPRLVRQVRQAELRPAEDGVHAGVGFAVEHVAHIDAPIEGQPLRQLKRAGDGS